MSAFKFNGMKNSKGWCIFLRTQFCLSHLCLRRDGTLIRTHCWIAICSFFFHNSWWMMSYNELPASAYKGKVWLIEPTHYILIEHVICYRPKLIWLLLPSDFPMRCLVCKDLKYTNWSGDPSARIFYLESFFHRGRATMCKDPSVKKTGVKKIPSAFRVPYKQWGCRGNSKHKTRLELQLN